MHWHKGVISEKNKQLFFFFFCLILVKFSSSSNTYVLVLMSWFHPLTCFLHESKMDTGMPGLYPHNTHPRAKAIVTSQAGHGVSKSRTRLSNFTFTFYLPALEKEMATHSSVLAWRIPGMGEPGGLPSRGSHRVGHD